MWFVARGVANRLVRVGKNIEYMWRRKVFMLESEIENSGKITSLWQFLLCCGVVCCYLATEVNGDFNSKIDCLFFCAEFRTCRQGVEAIVSHDFLL